MKKGKANITVQEVVIHKDCPVRQARCYTNKWNQIDPRLKRLGIKNIVSAKNFTPVNQAQLIDVVVRAATESMTVGEIAREVMKHPAFASCFGYNIDDTLDMYHRVLGRVRRHNKIDSAGRQIKRNALLG